MRAVYVPLVVVQRPRLVQDRVGDRHLAHVVQQEAELELGREHQLGGELARGLQTVGGDALGVLAGVGVSRLDRVGQGTDRGHVGAAELLGAGSLALERLA
jgi:hypothetical protein